MTSTSDPCPAARTRSARCATLKWTRSMRCVPSAAEKVHTCVPPDTAVAAVSMSAAVPLGLLAHVAPVSVGFRKL